MIEVGKTYLIAITYDNIVAIALERDFDGLIDPSRMRGEVTQIHPFGFLFKPVVVMKECSQQWKDLNESKIRKIGELNIIWNMLRWVFPEDAV